MKRREGEQQRQRQRHRRDLGRRWGFEGSIFGGGGSNACVLAFDRRIKVGFWYGGNLDQGLNLRFEKKKKKQRGFFFVFLSVFEGFLGWDSAAAAAAAASGHETREATSGVGV